jgi:hypothetical protein
MRHVWFWSEGVELAACDPGRPLVFAVGNAVFQIDDVGATAVHAPPPTSTGASTSAADVGELRTVVDEGMVGPSTSLIGPGDVVHATLPGTFAVLAASGSLYALHRRRARCDDRLSIGVLHSDARIEIELPEESSLFAAAGDGVLAVVHRVRVRADEPQPPLVLHVFALRDGRIVRRSVGLGDAATYCRKTFVHGNCVWTWTQDRWFGFAHAELADVDANVSTAVRYEPLALPLHREPGEAEILFVLPTSLLVMHPQLGRVRPRRAPGPSSLKKGDRVWLEGAYNTPGGWQAIGFTAVSGGERYAGEPGEAIMAAAPVVREALAPMAPRAGHHRADLESIARARGFRIPAALARFLDQVDQDAALDRHLDALGLIVHVAPLHDENDDEGDPSWIAIFHRGNGDAIGLLTATSDLHPDGTPPVLDYFHETREATRYAEHFDDAFLRTLIADAIDNEEGAMRDEDLRLAAMITTKLGLGISA